MFPFYTDNNKYIQDTLNTLLSLLVLINNFSKMAGNIINIPMSATFKNNLNHNNHPKQTNKTIQICMHKHTRKLTKHSQTKNLEKT